MDNGIIWRELLYRHWGKVLGGLLFLVMGIIYLHYGFWRTLFLLLMTVLGVYLGGKMLDKNEDFHVFIRDLWPFHRNRS